MDEGQIRRYQPLMISGGNITQRKSGDMLKLLGADADILSLGDATHEGGDLKIYRDGSGNLALSFDADAASNAKALDVYGGIVAQNYLTVGQTALNTTYPVYIIGSAYASGTMVMTICNTQDIRPNANTSVLPINIGVTDSNNHRIKIGIDGSELLGVEATGDGIGGIVGKRIVVTGGQCHAKTDAGAADYNPSAITSDYIITVDTTAAARAVTISTEDRDSGSAASPRVFIIKDIAGNAGTNNITVSLETAGTIDGAATFVINGDYNSITLIIDGTNGYVI